MGSKMIEITGADLRRFCHVVYNMSSQRGLGLEQKDCDSLPAEAFDEMIHLGWKHFHELKARDEDFPRKLSDQMGLINSEEDLQYYVQKGIDHARAKYDKQMTYLFGMDYVLGCGCKMSVFVKGYEQHRLFINPSWLDHSDEQFEALRKQFEIGVKQ